MARDEQRRAAVGEAVEELPQVAAQQRIEPDRRLVEDEQVGLAEQRGRERDAGALAAGQPVDDPVAVLLERDVRERALDGRGVGWPSTRAKKRRFSRTERSPYTDGACVM